MPGPSFCRADCDPRDRRRKPLGTPRSRPRPIRPRAFTLIELLIVIVILGIIAAIVVPQFTIATDIARLQALRTNLATIRAQLRLYRTEHDELWPTDQIVNQLTAVTDDNGNVTDSGSCGPYLLSIPVNPFNSASAIDTSGALGGGTTTGWWYDTTTGDFRADTTDHTTW